MRVPVLVWVGPAPAKAAGAGLLLMYASSAAGVSPGSGWTMRVAIPNSPTARSESVFKSTLGELRST